MFLLRRGEIEGRLDPIAYHAIRREALACIKSIQAQLLPLKHVARFLKNIVTENTDSLKYVGLENVQSHTGELVASSEVKSSFGTALSFNNGNILYAKLRPYLNKVYLAEFEGVCSTEFVVLDAHSVEPEFLATFLSSHLVVSQTSCLMTGNTLPRLQVEDIEKLLIPIPPLETQQDIIARMNAAYAAKRAREAEARELLGSIDDYILGELGITLPDEHRETTFRTSFRNVLGGRLDPLYIQNINLYRNTVRKYHYKRLGEILTSPPQYGAAESAKDGDPLNDIRYIRITDIDDFGNLKHDDWKTAESIEMKYILAADDVLFARSGATAGKTFLYKNQDSKAIFAGYLIRFRVDKGQILPEYLFYYTRTRLYEWWVRLIQRPSAQPNINAEEYKSLEIPLPPLEIQERIAAECRRRRERARELEQTARAIVEEAKREVERMITGEA